MGQSSYSMAEALILTDKDFRGCIEAFNVVTKDANLVINEANNDSSLIIMNIPNGIPTKEYLVLKEDVERANVDKRSLSKLLTIVLDNVYYGE